MTDQTDEGALVGDIVFAEIKVSSNGKFIVGTTEDNKEYQLYYYTQLQDAINNQKDKNGYIPPIYGSASNPYGSVPWPNYMLSFLERFRPVMSNANLKIDPNINDQIGSQQRDGTIPGTQVTFGLWPLYYVAAGNDEKAKSKHPVLFDAVTKDLPPLHEPPEPPTFPPTGMGP